MPVNRKWIQSICVALVAALLLTGCTGVDLNKFLRPEVVPFADMEYVRPDQQEITNLAAVVAADLEAGASVEALMENVFSFMDAYDAFCTNYALANIYYCKDLTDPQWEAEYNLCLEMASEVDALLDRMLYDLADSPLREELESDAYFGQNFFDNYEGDSLWDEGFTALMEEESRLQSEYYALSAQAQEMDMGSELFYATCGAKMAELFADLVALRQEIAQYVGYDDYLSFAYDFYYFRDYTPQQVQLLLEDIRQQLVPLYRDTAESDIWLLASQYSTQEQTFAYSKNAAAAMGGIPAEAFALLEKAKLYDISYSQNKYPASFETYLYTYYEPYVFLNPTMRIMDRLTFTHEFGHFCNDYASYGTVAGIDVAEVFSQGMEYLSLCYGEDSTAMRKLKMLDSLCVYVEQAAYASFEQQVYALDAEELTAEKIRQIYEQVGTNFGFDVWQWDSRSFVNITHFYTNPMYVISYVVSNDAALQLYEMEREETGSGLKVFEDNLTTQEPYFLAFVESAGLKSPFTEGRVAQVRLLLEDIIKH